LSEIETGNPKDPIGSFAKLKYPIAKVVPKAK
jgi:hypothetical protein